MSKPQLNINVDGIMLVGLGVGVPLLGFLGYKLMTAKEEMIEAVNPASQNNLVNRAVNSVGSALTGDENFTLGGWTYDWTHHADGSINMDNAFSLANLIPGAGSGIATVWEGAKTAAPYINPASSSNVVYQGVTKAVGEKNMATAGDKVFGLIDLLNPWNDSDAYARVVWGLDE